MAFHLFHCAVTMLSCVFAASGNSCASLGSDVASIQSVVSTYVKSAWVPGFSADLSRLDLASSSAAAIAKALSSWMDLPVGSFGGGWEEESMRQSLDQKKEEILSACSRAQKDVARLNSEIVALVQRNHLDLQKYQQVHSTLVSMASNMISSHRGLGVENMLMATQGSKLLEMRVKGHAKTMEANERQKGDAIAMLHVPRLFVPSHDLVVEQARRLKAARDQQNVQKREL